MSSSSLLGLVVMKGNESELKRFLAVQACRALLSEGRNAPREEGGESPMKDPKALLVLACTCESSEQFMFLAQPYLGDQVEGVPPMDVLCRRGMRDAARFLLEHNPLDRRDRRDVEHWLDLSAEHGHPGVAELFVHSAPACKRAFLRMVKSGFVQEAAVLVHNEHFRVDSDVVRAAMPFPRLFIQHVARSIGEQDGVNGLDAAHGAAIMAQAREQFRGEQAAVTARAWDDLKANPTLFHNARYAERVKNIRAYLMRRRAEAGVATFSLDPSVPPDPVELSGEGGR